MTYKVSLSLGDSWLAFCNGFWVGFWWIWVIQFSFEIFLKQYFRKIFFHIIITRTRKSHNLWYTHTNRVIIYIIGDTIQLPQILLKWHQRAHASENMNNSFKTNFHCFSSLSFLLTNTMIMVWGNSWF